MVDRCRAGTFSQLEMNRGLPVPTLARHFTKQGMDWRINDSVKRLVEVGKANLVAPSTMAQLGGIDIVVLRNVLIYFDLETKRTILRNVRHQMSDDGVMLLGAVGDGDQPLHGFRAPAGRELDVLPAPMSERRHDGREAREGNSGMMLQQDELTVLAGGVWGETSSTGCRGRRTGNRAVGSVADLVRQHLRRLERLRVARGAQGARPHGRGRHVRHRRRGGER